MRIENPTNQLNGVACVALIRKGKAIGCCRMTMRYQTTRADDAGLRQRMRAIAQERRRFGYRRLHVLLKREGYLINHKKLFRLYREGKLAVRRRGGRKRAIGTRAPMMVPMAPNERWSLDFVSDQLTDGRRFRVLTVLDDCTCACRKSNPAILMVQSAQDWMADNAARSFGSARYRRVLVQ
jgi:putative transposase